MLISRLKDPSLLVNMAYVDGNWIDADDGTTVELILTDDTHRTRIIDCGSHSRFVKIGTSSRTELNQFNSGKHNLCQL